MRKLAVGSAGRRRRLRCRRSSRSRRGRPSNGCLERMEVHLSQLPRRRDAGRRPVHPAVRGSVPDEVLRCRDHAVAQRSLACSPLHEGDAHPRHEVRILAERLLAAPPARVAADVEKHGSEAVMRVAARISTADRRSASWTQTSDEVPSCSRARSPAGRRWPRAPSGRSRPPRAGSPGCRAASVPAR